MKKILLCAPINEKEHIFKLYLKKLRKLYIPEGYEVHKTFFLHNCEHLKKHIKSELNEDFYTFNDIHEYKKDEFTHSWEQGNFKAVVRMKNSLLDIARKEKYDYLFYVDSDLILHENTLLELLDANKNMIAEIFWTQWEKGGQYLPNCWTRDHYSIDKAEFEKWKTKRGNHVVGMTGACTLIKRDLFMKEYINWNPIYNLSMSVWEDRAFCMKVALTDLIYINNKYPAIHLYRESDYNRYLRYKK